MGCAGQTSSMGTLPAQNCGRRRKVMLHERIPRFGMCSVHTIIADTCCLTQAM